MTQRWLPKPRFDELLVALAAQGYETIGPTLADGAIVYGPVRSSADLPIGWTDQQAPGSYRLERGDGQTWFGFAVGPHSWKKFLFPPRLRLWQARRAEEGFTVETSQEPPPKRAFLGVRGCELHAIAVQDRAFLDRDGQVVDPHYAAARGRSLLIGVECQHPAATCFCASMGTGPAIEPERIPLPQANQATEAPIDLVLAELPDGFTATAHSSEGEALLQALGLAEAAAEQAKRAKEGVAAAAQRMGRSVAVDGIQALLHRNQEHPRWDLVADRCLACTNCTMVCPTCFCMSVEETTDLTLEVSARERVWDSCFNPDFGAVHGGNFRASIRGRYRQWLTHKFSSWFDQFGVSGCVGCGRCVTWCPVGIDVTEELAAIRSSDGMRKEEP